MEDFYFSVPLFVLLVSCFVAVDFVFIISWPFCCYVLLSLSFSSSLFVFFLSEVFILMWVGLGMIFCWSENKFSCFGFVCKYWSVGMDVWL